MSGFLRLGQRMAQRNNLGLFAWVAAVLLPVALQFVAGVQEEVRLYLGEWYGPFTLYFFFVMTYGFATIFVCFYQLSSYRRQGTLDMLRIARLTPWEVLRDVFIQLQRTLLPPIAGFALIFVGYMLYSSDRLTIMGMGGTTIAGGILNVALTEMVLCAIVCLGLLRAEAALSAFAALLVLPLNVAPIGLMFFAQRVRDRVVESHLGTGNFPQTASLQEMEAAAVASMPVITRAFTAAPWLFYVFGMSVVVMLLLWLAKMRLAQLWPAQVRPGKS